MIKTETVEINGTPYLHTCSDAGYMIERDGVQYSDAVDPMDLRREYTETDVVNEVITEEEFEGYISKKYSTKS